MKLYEQLRKEEMPGSDLKEFLAQLPLTDILDSWSSLTAEEHLQVFLNLPTDTKVDLVNELSPPEQEHLIGLLSEQHIRAFLEGMEPDDVADFMQAVNPEVRKAVWDNLSEEAKRETLFLLRFDEDDAAGIMTPRYLAVRSSISVSQAMNFVRKNVENVETVYYIYVIDETKRLTGVISIKDLLSAKDQALVRDIMETQVISVLDETDQEEAARILETYDLIALPVVDAYHRLLGIITFDDVIDVIREEHTEDTYRMGAIGGTATRYLDTSVFGLVKKRVPWLIILLLVGTITTNVLHHYESIILGAAFLFMFMPVIIQTGGNSGGQSATLMIRGLATEEIHTRDFWRILLKELVVGLLMGIITGAVILLRSYVLPPGVTIYQALTIGLSLTFVVLFSTVVGACAPLIIRRLGFDPTVMSTPLMATLIDVCGLTIYFEIARTLLNL
ncbi:MAG: magnesium transporter [Spirochaetales bacterium]|nr:magnesium transporter [Spirochaetales bacterium]